MKIVDLDGQSQEWKIKGHLLHTSLARQSRSDLHIKARQLLKEVFPTFKIFEEVPIPIIKGKTLYLDFYMPLRLLAIEVHGEQHYKFVPFFHHNIQTFMKQKRNDHDKRDWCELNGIELMILPYNEDINEWKHKFG